MPIEYDEKRDFIRMSADHDLQFREAGSDTTHSGICKNLSATGILFSSDTAFPPGTRLEVNISPRYSVVAPFDAEVEVLRADPDDSGKFDIASKIINISNQ